MAEYLTKLRELRNLPEGLHWFCHKYIPGTSAYDSKIECSIGENLALRKEYVSECLKLFAFDGEDALRYQTQLAEGIDAQLSRCDLCIVGYYKSRQQLIEKLRNDYDGDEVAELIRIFDSRDINRIKKGLDKANKILKIAEPASRHKDLLDLSSQLALFEALSCEGFLAEKTLMNDHFLEPFKLVQTNKRLKITHYVPAATIFLFDDDHVKSTWAIHVWSKYGLVPSEDDFNFAVRDPLLKNMQCFLEMVPDMDSLRRLWLGIGLVVNRLDNNLVTHSLRAMDVDIFRLALEHLKYDMEGLRFLIRAIQRLLEIAPADFWDSMGAISPTTFIEQIFNNPQYDRFMEKAKENEDYESSALKDMLSWVKPFMASLKTVHQARACRSLVFQLLNRLQADRFPLYARIDCKRIGLATLAWTLSNCNKEGVTLSHTGRVVSAESLEVASDHIKDIINIPALPADDQARDACSEACLKIIKTALALECKSLKTDQEALKQNKDLPDGYGSYSPAIWDAVVQHLDRGNITVARSVLVGINDLTGLEKFKVDADDTNIKEKSAFNVKFGRLTHLVSQILERINDFKPADLDKLFRHSDTATALVAALFSPDTNLYEAGVTLIKSISSEVARKEAIGHLLKIFLETTLNAFSWAIRRIAQNRTFASCPRMLKTSTDVLEILCDSQNGLLRTRTLSDLGEVNAVENFWEHQWEGIKVIYEMTEIWGRAKVAESGILKEFCRDTMQFSWRLFDQYSVFQTAVGSAARIKLEEGFTEISDNAAGKELLKHPAQVTEAMVKWLRLRDPFLIEISVKLTTKVLDRLTELKMKLPKGPCDYLEQLVNNRSQARSKLQPQEKAELVRALEANLDRSLIYLNSDREDSGTLSDGSREQTVAIKKTGKAGVIDLSAWRSKAKLTDYAAETSDDEFKDTDLLDQDLLSVTRSAELMKEMQASAVQRSSQPQTSKKAQAREGKVTLPALHDQRNIKSVKASPSSEAERVEFREKREKEREAKKKRDAETLALVKKKAGLSTSALGEGSGLGGIGVRGKDHAPKVQSMMVSSGSESESEDDLDRELFGGASKPAKVPNDARFYKPSQALQAQSKAPIKKTRQVRSAKDMRARLAPDLTSLHRTLLGWDFFHNGDFPPGSDRNDYSLVSNVFRTPLDYQQTFEPLLVLEAWQGFLKSKEEGNFKSFEVKIANRMNVDAFLEVSTSISIAEGKELGISETDIVLISKHQSPAAEAQQPHCLARVWKINRKKAAMEITYRANVGNGLVTSMVPNATLYAIKLLSITPLEREYGALLGLKFFDLCDEIIKAKPSPLLEYSEKHLAPLVLNYDINIAQAKAVKSAVENDAFTLIQGPPGSGKTKTIVAIVGALLTGSFVDKAFPIARPSVSNGQRLGNGTAAKKLLVCAPSNAAVDELVQRLREGVKTMDGISQKLSVIRLGRSDAINANVIDVTLEELVNAKLSLASGRRSGGDDIQKLMMAHKTTSEELNVLRNQVDQLKANGTAISSDQDRRFELLKRKKQQLSSQIDAARDNVDVVIRDAELSRRRVQQEILDGAHVICSTLSGSGHEMFQGLNIEFETVIIDEAAQSIELSALIPLKYGCSKCILVGDPKQLPPTVLSREAARFQYEQSLFVRMQRNHSKDVHLLDTQYRMHPEISIFPSNTFYDARLLDGPGMAKLRTRPWHQSRILGPYRFFDVQGHHQSAPRGHSLLNLAEIDIALRLYDRLVTDCKGYDFKGKIGIITPYKSQLRELRSRFATRYGENVFTTIEFNTTDAFQGRECEIIIFSCVRASFSKGIGFLSDIRRMNVGITRAKCSLWVLGNSQSLMQGEFWGRLIQDAKDRDRYTAGDLTNLLKSPALRFDSASATVNSTSPLAFTSPLHINDVDMPDAPMFEGSAPPNSRHDLTDGDKTKNYRVQGEADTMAYQPAGGANGLNPGGNCKRCGSFTHHTHVCDNPDAQAQMGMQCFRCNGSGHTKAFCTVDRCLTCGDFGHVQRTCTSTKYLSNKDKLRIGKQEAEHTILMQRAPEMHRKRQLGDHDKQVPTVRSTSGTPPVSGSSFVVSGATLRTGEKRRRGSSPPASVSREFKVMKGEQEINQQGRVKFLEDLKSPLDRLPNNGLPNERPEVSFQNTAPSKQGGDGPVSIMPYSLAAPADQRQASKRERSAKESTEPAVQPRRPTALVPRITNPNELSANRGQTEVSNFRSRDHQKSSNSTSEGCASGSGVRQRDDHGSEQQDRDIVRIMEQHRQREDPNIMGHVTARPTHSQPNMVRKPKRKKEVDPFIRPKKRA